MKLCPKCNELKDENDFSKHKTKKDGLQWKCKECMKEYNKEYRQLNQNKTREYSKKYNKKYRQLNHKKILEKKKEYRHAHRIGSLSENKNCSCYLGIHIAEGLVAKYFKNPLRMPQRNPGYDFICSNGYKIDVKSSTLTIPNRWIFTIKKNKIADYFLCLAFDNRSDLNLIHVWLFPGHVINNAEKISSIPSTTSKWLQYEKPIDDMKVCCETLKETMI